MESKRQQNPHVRPGGPARDNRTSLPAGGCGARIPHCCTASGNRRLKKKILGARSKHPPVGHTWAPYRRGWPPSTSPDPVTSPTHSGDAAMRLQRWLAWAGPGPFREPRERPWPQAAGRRTTKRVRYGVVGTGPHTIFHCLKCL